MPCVGKNGIRGLGHAPGDEPRLRGLDYLRTYPSGTFGDRNGKAERGEDLAAHAWN